jgi:hypothetical protein
MNINILLYNILFIILLVVLIYLFIYINNKYIETFVDNEASTTQTSQSLIESNSAISGVGTNPSPPIVTFIPERKPWEFKGVDIETSVPSAEYLQCYYDVFKAIPSANVTSPFTSGYYWVNFQDYTVGNRGNNNKYTYCLLDKTFGGGGWMLAMRAVKNSTRFDFNSPYWTSMGTFNDSAEYINNDSTGIIQGISNSDLNNVSSIGTHIYDASSTADSDKYDAKFQAFDTYRAKEWLIIFYIDRNKTGGDYNNSRGWVWHERNLPTNAQGQPYTAREIFSGAHARTGSISELQLSTRENYGGVENNVDITTLKKFYKNYSTGSAIPTPNIWSPQPGYNWYGINYHHSGILNQNEPRLMRLGFVLNSATHAGTNRVIAGIGLNYNGRSVVDQTTPAMPANAQYNYTKTDKYSAGNVVLKFTGENDTFVRSTIISNMIRNGVTLGQGEINTSFAFEFYVR